MNIHDIQSCFTLVCAVGGIACIAAILLYSARHQLRRLFDRWLALGHLGQCVSLLMLTVFVLYGGSKPGTNEVEIVGGEDTNEVEIVGGGGQSNLTSCSFGLQRVGAVLCPPPPLLSTLPATPSLLFTTVTNWTARGAWNDWRRINFPGGFAFPCGTNLLSSVTLMSYGEIRENLRCSPSAFTLSLPHPVSLEPGVSTCAYGLTASNSFVFAWHDACVEREATNRVDAAIELFASGDVQVRFGDSVTNIVARPPEGFVGVGQDNAWALAAFPDDYDAITNKGYEAWLMEDKVGINEPNGKYMVSVTVAELPEYGPCYLFVGSYKVVVTEPGTYSFPLEVFEHYVARTYPTAVPLSFDYDDGYRGDEPGFCLLAPPRQLLGVPLIFPPVYDIFQVPRFVVTPDTVPLNEAPGTEVSLWCNVAGEIQCYCRSIWRTTKVIFRGSREAEVVEAIIADEVDFILLHAKGSCSATLSITPSPLPCCPDCCGDDCHCDGTCCACNCGCHSGGNSNTNAPPNVSQP